MRFHIVLASLLLVLVFAVALERRFEWRQKPQLTQEAHNRLAKAHLDGITVSLDHFDARLDGFCSDPDGREKAQAIVERMAGVRVPEWNNHVRVPAKILHKINDNTISLSGWLTNNERKEDLAHWVKEFRPELKFDDSGIRTSPHVDEGDSTTIMEGKISKVFADVLEAIRVPPRFAIDRQQDKILVTGRVQSDTLAKAIRDAVKTSRNASSTTVDVTANKHTPSAPFAKGDALAKFAASFLDSPSPGTFSIDTLNSPKLRAHATAKMESEWLALLRVVSGPTKVVTTITRAPTIYHFPDYLIESPLPADQAQALQALFKTQRLYFDTGSATIRAEEAVKLGPLIYQLNSTPPGCTFVIAASADSAGEPGTTNDSIQRSRGDSVRVKLSQLGLRPDVAFEVIVFNAAPDLSLPADEARRQTRRVEFLIK